MMMPEPTLDERLAALGVVPIVTLPDASLAVPLARALTDGGLRGVEVTLRTDDALHGLAAIRETFPDLLLGAGTVLTEAQVPDAVAAGADFIVAPGTAPEVIAACQDAGIPILPGVATPSEIDRARRLGVRTLKFFPAEPLGGAHTLRVLCGPFQDVAFVPTGGVLPALLPGYFELDQVLACGGSWMVSPNLLAEGNFERVRTLAAEARRIADAR